MGGGGSAVATARNGRTLTRPNCEVGWDSVPTGWDRVPTGELRSGRAWETRR
jgi:hypothetical protein